MSLASLSDDCGSVLSVLIRVSTVSGLDSRFVGHEMLHSLLVIE